MVGAQANALSGRKIPRRYHSGKILRTGAIRCLSITKACIGTSCLRLLRTGYAGSLHRASG